MTRLDGHSDLPKSPKQMNKQIKIIQVDTYMYEFRVQLAVWIGEEKFHPCLQLRGACDCSEVPMKSLNKLKVISAPSLGYTVLLVSTSKIS